MLKYLVLGMVAVGFTAIEANAETVYYRSNCANGRCGYTKVIVKDSVIRVTAAKAAPVVKSEVATKSTAAEPKVVEKTPTKTVSTTTPRVSSYKSNSSCANGRCRSSYTKRRRWFR